MRLFKMQNTACCCTPQSRSIQVNSVTCVCAINGKDSVLTIPLIQSLCDVVHPAPNAVVANAKCCSWISRQSSSTVDGRNPAAVDMEESIQFLYSFTIHFFHPQRFRQSHNVSSFFSVFWWGGWNQSCDGAASLSHNVSSFFAVFWWGGWNQSCDGAASLKSEFLATADSACLARAGLILVEICKL